MHIVLSMSNLEEIRVSYNTSRGFPWEHDLLSEVFLRATGKRKKERFGIPWSLGQEHETQLRGGESGV